MNPQPALQANTPEEPPAIPQTGHGSFWRRLVALTRKEFRQLIRDNSNIGIGIALPIVLILIFGFGMSMDVRNAAVAIVLDDASAGARDVIAALEGTPYIHPVILHSMPVAEQLMLDHRVEGILRIPADFSRKLAAGQASLQLIVHGADAATARVVQGYVAGALAHWSAQQANRAAARGSHYAPIGTIQVQPRFWFNAANNSSWYLVPGLIVIIITLIGAFLTALMMAREWERGTLEALFVSPVRPTEILLAKLIPVFCVGMIGFAMCLAAARWIFHVPFVGSALMLLLGSCLYLFVALGMGLLISAATKNQFLASQAALLSSFLPATMLSGFLFDLRNVPTAIRVIGNALPATHFLRLIRTVFLAGNVWSLLWREIAILMAYAILLLAAARFVTRKRLL